MKKRLPRGKPQHLPEGLKAESPLVKLVYVYLKGRGEVDYSLTSLADALGCARNGICRAISVLRELEFIEYEGKPRGNAKYKIAVPDRIT